MPAAGAWQTMTTYELEQAYTAGRAEVMARGRNRVTQRRDLRAEAHAAGLAACAELGARSVREAAQL